MRDGRMIGTWPTSRADASTRSSRGWSAASSPTASRAKRIDPGDVAARGRTLTSADPRLVPRTSPSAAPRRGARHRRARGRAAHRARRGHLRPARRSPRATIGSTGAGRHPLAHRRQARWAWRCSPRTAALSGVVPTRSVFENAILATRSRVRQPARASSTRGGRRRDARRVLGRLRVRTPSLQTPITSLSGGNQQKVLFARWLLAEPGDPHPRRADARHRRGRQVRDLHDHQRARRTGEGHHHDLVGAARADRRIRSHRRHVPRPADRHRGSRGRRRGHDHAPRDRHPRREPEVAAGV